MNDGPSDPKQAAKDALRAMTTEERQKFLVKEAKAMGR
jgi:hypothetical protein